MKNKVIIGILVVTGVLSLILQCFDKNPVPVIALGCLSSFLLYALWDPPPKHKTFSYKDQLKATTRALGGSGPPDLPEPEKRRRRKKTD